MRYLALLIALAAAVCALLSPYYQLDSLPALAPGLTARNVPPATQPKNTPPKQPNHDKNKPDPNKNIPDPNKNIPDPNKNKPHHPDENPPSHEQNDLPPDPSRQYDLTQLANSHIIKYSQATQIKRESFSIDINGDWQPIDKRYVQLSEDQRRGIIKRTVYEATISLDDLNLQDGTKYRIGYQVKSKGEFCTDYFFWQTSTQSPAVEQSDQSATQTPSGTATPAPSTSSPSPRPSSGPVSGEAPSTFCGTSAWFWSPLFMIFWWHV